MRDCTVVYASAYLSEFTCVVREGDRLRGDIEAHQVAPESVSWASWNCSGSNFEGTCTVALSGTVSALSNRPRLTDVVVEPSIQRNR